jgi:hypothetical protein
MATNDRFCPARFLESRLWRSRSEMALRPHLFRSMMVSGCTCGEGLLLPLLVQHVTALHLPDPATLQMVLSAHNGLCRFTPQVFCYLTTLTGSMAPALSGIGRLVSPGGDIFLLNTGDSPMRTRPQSQHRRYLHPRHSKHRCSDHTTPHRSVGTRSPSLLGSSPSSAERPFRPWSSTRAHLPPADGQQCHRLRSCLRLEPERCQHLPLSR